MFPDNISKTSILDAIAEIDQQGIRKGRHSSTYDLIFEGKSYPPKLVISIANRFANGVELDGDSFNGGMGTPAFNLLQSKGFDIVPKQNPQRRLIEDYKARITNTKLRDEVYKWQIIEGGVGHPDPTVPDFLKEIENLNYSNLIYPMALAVLKHIAQSKAEELRQMFIALFDESIELESRVSSFNKDTLALYHEINGKNQHHQDERSISTYLAVHNPQKYTFYKATMYAKYCELLGIKTEKKNKKYVHYLELLDALITNYIIPDQELIDLVKSLIPEHYDGSNHLLLAQDILYQMLEKTHEPNYWIFQGNPSLYDFETSLKEGLLNNWSVRAHKDKIVPGDKVILWLGGDQPGCYALAEVTSEPHEMDVSDDDHLWKEKQTGDLKVDIKITHNLVHSPILKEQLEELPNMKVGHQGTNFTATEEEYETILDMIDSAKPGSYAKVCQMLDKKKLEQYLAILRKFIQENELSSDNDNLSFNARPAKRHLGFIIGRRYGLSISARKKKTIISFISEKKLSKNPDEFTNHIGEVEAYWNPLDDVSGYEDEIISGMLQELKRGHKNPFRKFNNIDFMNDVFQESARMQSDKSTSLKSLNTILYGPPGTGKTFRLKNEYFDQFTSSQVEITRVEYLKRECAALSWWEVIALAVMDLGRTKVADIADHEFVKHKIAASNSKTVNPTIWGQLQSHTIEECEYVNVAKKSQILIFNKTKDAQWEIVTDRIEEQSPHLLTFKEKFDNYTPSTESKKRYVFTTFHQSMSYEDFIEGIKPRLQVDNETAEIQNQIEYEIKPGIFRRIVEEAIADPENDYALFIDEINRGNIASIFGELITLIEDDKRIKRSNFIPAILPYSREEFGVPPNLYIIGTMNTADRSVEALDTALRRRFSFVEMNPDPVLLAQPEYACEGIDLATMLSTINGRIEKLLDKDYQIGHSYFMTIQDRDDPLAEIKTIFENKILPLLQEYFYGDWGKIRLVLGPEFVVKKEDTIQFLTAGMDEDYEEYSEKPIYSFTDTKKWTIDSFKSIYAK